MTKIIGATYQHNEFIQLYFRNELGYKFLIPIYASDTGFGRAKDMYLCSQIPIMTYEEFIVLPDKKL